jgi:hypothetical protein
MKRRWLISLSFAGACIAGVASGQSVRFEEARTEIRLLIENEKRRTALQNLAADLSRRALFVTGQL